MHPKILVALTELHRVPLEPRYTRCLDCKAEFTDANVLTPSGWRETQISGTCETCFDEMFADDGDEGFDEELENLQDAYEVLPKERSDA